MFRHQGKTRTFMHNLKVAPLLSFVAGLVNVYGFLTVQRHSALPRIKGMSKPNQSQLINLFINRFHHVHINTALKLCKFK